MTGKPDLSAITSRYEKATPAQREALCRLSDGTVGHWLKDVKVAKADLREALSYVGELESQVKARRDLVLEMAEGIRNGAEAIRYLLAFPNAPKAQEGARRWMASFNQTEGNTLTTEDKGE